MKGKVLLTAIILTVTCMIQSRHPDQPIKQELTTFILVRHAEKVLDNSKDPALTDAGRQRAKDLRFILTHIPIDSIYSTPYKRTRTTVAPVAKSKGLAVTTYVPLQELDFLSKLLKSHQGKTILICGHSNTIPVMVSILTGDRKVIPIQDHVYDNLFIISARTIGDAVLFRIRFGTPTPEKPQ